MKEQLISDGTYKQALSADGNVVERMEEKSDDLYYQEHLIRYEFANKIAKGKTLDIATGGGAGSKILSLNPKVSSVHGVDIDLPSLQKNRMKYPNKKIAFIAADGTKLPYADESFDTLVVPETIEHIKNYGLFLDELRRVVKPEGVSLFTTPDRTYSEKHKIYNPFHTQEFYADELKSLLLEYYGQIRIFHQGYSDDYYSRVENHATAIQEKKRDLPPIVQAGIKYFYRPLKNLIPEHLNGRLVQHTLGLEYPLPNKDELVIIEEPGRLPRDPSVTLAVCTNPRK